MRLTLLTIPFALSILPLSPAFAQEVADKTTDTSTIRQSSVELGGQMIRETGSGLGDAALSPLEDLNLKRDKIPEEFNRFNTPYDPPPELTCEEIAFEVRTLDTLLEPDIDVQLEMIRRAEAAGEKKDGKIASQASGFALGTIASEARGLIPFRGLVRQATGASAHEKKVDAAFQRAFLRRAYLKGLGQGINCAYPAAPLPIQYTDKENTDNAPITYRADAPE